MCIDLPFGFMCDCPSGMRLVTDTHCEGEKWFTQVNWRNDIMWSSAYSVALETPLQKCFICCLWLAYFFPMSNNVQNRMVPELKQVVFNSLYDLNISSPVRWPTPCQIKYFFCSFNAGTFTNYTFNQTYKII